MQVLAPGMQHGEESDCGAQMAWVARNRGQGSGHHAEQEAVNHRFVLQSEGGDLFRHSEDYVEVRHRQQFGLALLEPLLPLGVLTFGTVPVAARVIRNPRKTTLAAFLNVAAQHGRTAGFDSAHHAQRLAGQGLLRAIRRAVLPKNVSQLQGWPGHGSLLSGGRPGGTRRWAHQSIQRAGSAGDDLHGHVGIARGGFQATAAQEGLNDPHIGAVL